MTLSSSTTATQRSPELRSLCQARQRASAFACAPLVSFDTIAERAWILRRELSVERPPALSARVPRTPAREKLAPPPPLSDRESGTRADESHVTALRSEAADARSGKDRVAASAIGSHGHERRRPAEPRLCARNPRTREKLAPPPLSDRQPRTRVEEARVAGAQRAGAADASSGKARAAASATVTKRRSSPRSSRAPRMTAST